jgi:putative transposase
LEQENSILKKGYRSLDVGRDESYALIDQLSEHEHVELVCSVFDISRSSYYDYKRRLSVIDVERLQQRSQVNQLFNESRGAAGSRTIVAMLQARGTDIGRFKIRSLMREAGLICKQPGPYKYKHATVERVDIPNTLSLEFDVPEANRV